MIADDLTATSTPSTPKDGSEAFAALLASLSDLNPSTASSFNPQNDTSTIPQNTHIIKPIKKREDSKDLKHREKILEAAKKLANSKSSHDDADLEMKDEDDEGNFSSGSNSSFSRHANGSNVRSRSTSPNGGIKRGDTALEKGISLEIGELDKETRKRRGRDTDWKPSTASSFYSSTSSNSTSTTSILSSSNNNRLKRSEPSTSNSSNSNGNNNNKKQRTNKKNQTDKVSFQEAAVRVLGEQREKGVYALSTRKIWELIQQSGLVDTKCKTPVSSLSSRITEDVRTKGNKSVFVRVGEGLYTLRKGLKKAELEKYLQSKYPHSLAGGQAVADEQLADEDLESGEPIETSSEEHNDSKEEEYDENSEEVPEKEEEQELEEEEEAEEQKQEDQVVEVTEKSPPPAPVKPPIESHWIGLPLKTNLNGDVCYRAVGVDGFKYSIGDCAFFTPNSGDPHPYIGQITKLWQTNNVSKDKSGNMGEHMFVQCIWYYYPEDTYCGRTKRNHKRELFFSDLSDVNNVNSLISSVEVVSYEEYSKRLCEVSKKDLTRLFFCRFFYTENTKQFLPLKFNPRQCHYYIEGLEEEQKLPSNWPLNEVTYAPHAAWRIPETFRRNFDKKFESNVELRKLTNPDDKVKSVNNNSPTNDLVVVVSLNIKAGSIIGEYSGAITVASNQPLGEEDDIPPKNPRNFFTLFQDDEVTVSLDSTQFGNEFKFILSSAECKQTPNVKLTPIWLAGKWHLMVLALVDLKKGTELIADIGQLSPVKGELVNQQSQLGQLVEQTHQHQQSLIRFPTQHDQQVEKDEALKSPNESRLPSTSATSAFLSLSSNQTQIQSQIQPKSHVNSLGAPSKQAVPPVSSIDPPEVLLIKEQPYLHVPHIPHEEPRETKNA